jgi:hypothetical protein
MHVPNPGFVEEIPPSEDGQSQSGNGNTNIGTGPRVRWDALPSGGSEYSENE